MGHIDVNGVAYSLPDGRPLLADVSFRVDEGSVTALVGPNGSGKTTLLRMIAAAATAEPGHPAGSGPLPTPDVGSISVSGTLGVMEQFVGSSRDDRSVADLLVSVAPGQLRRAGAALSAAEAAMGVDGSEASQLAYASALADWGDLGGYAAEVAFDAATTESLGLPLSSAGGRPVSSLSGGEQKRLVLTALLASPADLLVLDEPDNFLDVPGKEWLEEALAATKATVLIVSHDRELLARSATRVVTLEHSAGGSTAWVHGAGFATYAAAREERLNRLEELHRRYDEERARLKAYVDEMRRKAAYNSDFASKLRNAEHRLARFDAAGPPEALPRRQRLAMRLVGGRTGKRALTCTGLSLRGLTAPFDLEVVYGERVACLGPNGTGKSHFFRLLAGEAVDHEGTAVLGARVVARRFAQTYEHPELTGRELVDILHVDHDLPVERAVAALGRYGLAGARRQRYETLSGGQQARLQVLSLELSGATMLLLDEPTDNLDVESAEALEDGLDEFAGTVLAITHDRYFVRRFDRFVLFRADGTVTETPEAAFDEGRAERAAATRARSGSARGDAPR